LSSVWFLSFAQLMFVAVAAFTALAYSFPVIRHGAKRSLKDFGLIKILSLALLWVFVTCWLPFDDINFSDPNVQIVFARRFLFVFVLCLIFDLRDIELDRKDGRRTIAVVLGVKKTTGLCYALLLAFVGLSVYQLCLYRNLLLFNAMLISAIVTAFFLHITKWNNSPYLYLAGIDGTMLLQAALVAVALI
jgi:4-hydroxybenzoate polyprenyltransferase